MGSNEKNRFTTIAFLVIASFAFFTTCLNWWRQVTSDVFDPNQSGDWLLNYSGGFIRRGLFGQILDTVIPQAIDVVVVSALIQILLLATLFLIVGVLYFRTDRSPAWLMLCLSPAALLFPATNPEAAFRKELLVLLVVGILALGASNGINTRRLMVAAAAYILAIFSHEASVTAMPGILFLIYLFRKNRERNHLSLWFSIFIGISVIAFISSVLSPGNTIQAQAICNSWLERGIADCTSGALSSLTLSTQESISFLYSNFFPAYFIYIFVIALSVIPLFLVRFLPSNWRISLIVLIFVLPLFLVAWDYGRWIYLAITQLSLLALALSSKKTLRMPYRVPIVVALVFVLLWGFAWYENFWREGFAIQILQALAIIPQ